MLPKIRWAILTVMATSSAQPAFAYTGNDLVDWSRGFDAMQSGGVATWKDGMFVGYVAGVAETVNGVIYCPKREPTHLQNAAIVAKQLKANPEVWAEDASVIVVTALRSVSPCPKP